MVVGTRKTNATTRPGLIVLEGKQQRRTKEQIREDNALKKAENTTARMEAEASHHAMVSRIAQLENSIAQGEELVRGHAKRPDLRNNHRGAEIPVAGKC